MKPTILVSFQTVVNASEEKLWNLLVDKIKNPKKYIEAVQSSTILVEDDHLVHRSMVVSMNGNNVTIEEYITWNEVTKTVLFKMVNNPNYVGFVVNQIFTDEDKILLNFTLNWQLKAGSSAPIPDMETSIKEAVLHTKQLAETV